MLSTAHVDIFGDVLHDVDHLHLLVELQSLLGEIAEAHGVADVESSAVGRHQSEEQPDKRGLARTVISHDAHLLEAREVIVEVLQDDMVAESLRHILALKYLRADIDIARLQTDLPLLDALLGHLLQLIERLLTVAGLMSTGLRHASHPLQFRAVEVVGTGDLCPAVVDTLLALLEVVTVVAPIGIDGLVVEFEDDGTDTVEEKAVVGDHQQRLIAPAEETLQPLDHLKVEVVRRLVEDQQVGLGDEHIGQCHALLLSARELSHRLLQVADLQLGEDLLGFQHLLLISLMIEASIEYTLGRIEDGRLFEHTHPQVTTEDDVSRVVALHTGEDGKQRRFARTVLCDQSHLLPFGDGEADVAEQYQRAERLRQLLHV